MGICNHHCGYRPPRSSLILWLSYLIMNEPRRRSVVIGNTGWRLNPRVRERVARIQKRNYTSIIEETRFRRGLLNPPLDTVGPQIEKPETHDVYAQNNARAQVEHIRSMIESGESDERIAREIERGHGMSSSISPQCGQAYLEHLRAMGVVMRPMRKF